MGERFLRIGIVLWTGVVGFSADTGERSLTLFFTGMVQGAYQPCGCTAGPTGGLARRAGYIQKHSGEHGGVGISVDVGNYFHPPGPEAAAANALMMQSLKTFPVRVLNLATDDLYLWPELSRVPATQTQVISTNLSPRRSNTPRPARYAVVEVDGRPLGLARPLKIGFLGLSDPATVKPNSGFTGQDPLQAIGEVKKQITQEADFLIVLADLPRSVGKQIAAEHPEVFAVLLAERRFVLPPPEQVNNAVILNSVERGRYLGLLTLMLDEQGQVTTYQPEFIELNDKVPEDSGWLQQQREVAAAGSRR